MPMNRSLYSEDWEQVSKQVRERAGWKCEQCGVKNGALIRRQRSNPALWRYKKRNETHLLPGEYEIKVVLTVHHIGVTKPDGTPGSPADKLDNRPENLIALCQRCHLAADRDHHIAVRKQRAASKRYQQAIDAGQLPLFSTADDQPVTSSPPYRSDAS
jgi:5-methylcytosine-specific restriction endonuclease McrA